MLDESGWLDDIPTVPWNDGGVTLTPRFLMHELTALLRLHAVHPSLQFISHIPHSITGEQLVNQFLRCIPDKTWLFKYGRVPLNLVMGEWVWQVSSS
jgi:transcription factor 1